MRWFFKSKNIQGFLTTNKLWDARKFYGTTVFPILERNDRTRGDQVETGQQQMFTESRSVDKGHLSINSDCIPDLSCTPAHDVLLFISVFTCDMPRCSSTIQMIRDRLKLV